MDSGLKAIVSIAIFVTMLGILTFTIYDVEFESLLNQPEEEDNPMSGIPIIGGIVVFFGWIFAGISFLVNLLTFSLSSDPYGMPIYIVAIISIPIWAAILYIMMPVFSRIAEAIGNLIPFT